MLCNKVKMEANPNFTSQHLIYKQTKHLFHIPRFTPDKEMLTQLLKKQNKKETVFEGLYEALRKVQTFQLLPVVHATHLTKSQIEEVKKIASQYEVTDSEIDNFISEESGKDRLRRMIKKNELNERSDELAFIWDNTVKMTAIAYLGMFLLKLMNEKREFIRKSKSAVYFSGFSAGRQMRDTVITRSVLFGGAWAARCGLLAGSVLAVSQSIAVYRNKTSVLEYVIGTGVGCSLSRFMHGPEGMVGGFLIGSVIGLCIGIPVVMLMKSLNKTQEDRHKDQIRELLRYKKKIRGEIKKPLTTISEETQPKLEATIKSEETKPKLEATSKSEETKPKPGVTSKSEETKLKQEASSI
ncbi:complex I assembly factor TIMMDC1, mitochondrial-like [Mytilus edulis]